MGKKSELNSLITAQLVDKALTKGRRVKRMVAENNLRDDERNKMAMFWRKGENHVLQCVLCPHHCTIDDGESGRCGVRTNKKGHLTADSYGLVSAIALDPIEKKPLRRFESGKNILSIGSFGCNLKCPFCQNHGISLAYKNRRSHHKEMSPAQVTTMAEATIPKGNIGVAYTYNEPFVGYEFVLDCAKKVHRLGMKNVLVTNGFINPLPLGELMPYIDAMNIDLKCFSNESYKKLGGNLDDVKRTIKIAADVAHVEITTLIIPGENDSEEEIDKLTSWLATINQELPLHLSRFFPAYKCWQKETTPIDAMFKLEKVAREHLSVVFLGNV